MSWIVNRSGEHTGLLRTGVPTDGESRHRRLWSSPQTCGNVCQVSVQVAEATPYSGLPAGRYFWMTRPRDVVDDSSRSSL